MINITNGNAQAKTDQAAIDIGFFTHVRKMAIIIPQEFIAAAFQEICNRPVFWPGGRVCWNNSGCLRG